MGGRRQQLRSPATDQRGVVAVVVAISAVLLLSVAALAVDLGNAWARQRQVQTQVDLAALAGAAHLPAPAGDPATLAAVVDYLRANDTVGQDGTAWTPATLQNGSDADGEVYFLQSGRRLRVVAPPADVDFGLANVMGVSGVDVSAIASVEVRSPGAALPLMLRSGPCGWGIRYIKTPSGRGNECDHSQRGNFGTFVSPRSDVSGTGPALRENLRQGLDHDLAVHPAPDPDGSCPNDATTVLDVSPPRDGANCLVSDPGNSVGQVTDGLLGDSSGPGRLGVPTLPGCGPGGSSDELQVGSHWVNNDQLECFLKDGATAETVSLEVGAPVDVIDPRIFDSPRFFWVPVIGRTEFPNGQSGTSAIVGFRGVFLTEIEMQGAQVHGLRGVIINPASMPESATTSTGIGYLGTGPKLLRLVQ